MPLSTCPRHGGEGYGTASAFPSSRSGRMKHISVCAPTGHRRKMGSAPLAKTTTRPEAPLHKCGTGPLPLRTRR